MTTEQIRMVQERKSLYKKWMEEKHGPTRIELLRKVRLIESHLRKNKRTQ